VRGAKGQLTISDGSSSRRLWVDAWRGDSDLFLFFGNETRNYKTARWIDNLLLFF
jgi:hypothetical protein